jgi:acyl-CoA thioesterase FadM
MAHVKIDFPSQALYSQQLRVRITDINAANHLGFDNMVGILNDVAAGFLEAHGVSRTAPGGISVIFTDLSVRYMAEAFFGDILTVEVALGGRSPKGIDLLLKTTNRDSQKIISLARIGILFFDYQQRRPVPVTEDFLQRISSV